MQLSKIEAKLSSEGTYSFTIDVSDSEYFIKENKLPQDVTNTNPAQLIFFDSTNKVIEHQE